MVPIVMQTNSLKDNDLESINDKMSGVVHVEITSVQHFPTRLTVGVQRA